MDSLSLIYGLPSPAVQQEDVSAGDHQNLQWGRRGDIGREGVYQEEDTSSCNWMWKGVWKMGRGLILAGNRGTDLYSIQIALAAGGVEESVLIVVREIRVGPCIHVSVEETCVAFLDQL